MKKRLLSIGLALALVLSACPLEALAEEVVPEEEDQQAVLSQETEPVEVEFVEAETEEDPAPAEAEAEPEPEEEPAPEPAVLMEDSYTSGDYTYTVSDGKATITKYNGAGGDVVIPKTLDGNTIVTIGNNAFKHASLTSVTIPSTVTSIGSSAFQGASITGIEIPSSVTSIGSYAFAQCRKLTHITIPASVTSIGYNAFIDCSSLTTAGPVGGGYSYEFEWTTEIPDNALRYRWLKSIELPSSLSSIGYCAFQSTSLTSVTIPSSVTSIGSSAFQGASITGIEIPSSVTSIGSYAFAQCRKLTHLTIPASVTSIGNNAFIDCSSLTTAGPVGGGYSYEFEWTTEIPDNALRYRWLKNVVLPTTLTRIGNFAFQNTSLTSVTIPSSVSSIGNYAFQNASLTSVTIPSGVSSIGDEAFKGASLTSVTIPSTVTSIGSRAFQDCQKLTSIAIPASVSSIGNYAFYDCPVLTIICPYISRTTLYAIDNNIPFEPCGTITDSDAYALDYSATRLFGDINGMTANGYVAFTLNYKIKDVWKDKVSSMKAVIRLPKSLILDEESIRVDGAVCTDYRLNNTLLTIPLTRTEGEIRYMVKVTQPGDLVSYAKLSMKKDGAGAEEIMGILNERTALLTLNAPAQTGEKSFTVSGIAPPSTEVILSVDGEENTSAAASKAGSWTAQIKLKDPQNYRSCRITASCQNGDETLEQTTSVVYREDAASMTGFVVKYNEHNVIKEQDLRNTNGIKPRIYFVPGTEFVFEVWFDHPEQINTLYVTSTRNGEKKYLEAEYDEESNAFVTSGFFDPQNPRYIPGSINIEYTRNVPEVTVGQPVDWDTLAEQTNLDASKVVTVKENSADRYEATIDLSDLFSDWGEVALNTTISLYDAQTDGNLSDWIGGFKYADKIARYIVKGANGEDIEMSLDYSDPYSYLLVVKELSTNKIIKMVLDDAIEATEFGTDKYLALTDVASTLSVTGTVAGILINQYEISRDMDQLREEVMASPNLTQAERQAALSKVNELEFDESMFTLMVTILPLIVAAPVAVGATMSAAPLILFTGILAMMSATAPYFWAYRTGQIKGEKVFVNWVADPSGYVYDAETNARLEDVTATAYCIPYDDTEDFWDRVPGKDEYGTLWNAQEYDQENPLQTNADGKYAWDVPEGWWRVKYEKQDYETAWSDWMTVPPIQTEVNVGMVFTGKEAFSVEYTEWSETSGAVTLTNNTDGTAGVTLVLAAYTADGRMVSVGSKKAELKSAGSMSVTISYQKSEEVIKLQAFVLDADASIPLRSAAIRTV